MGRLLCPRLTPLRQHLLPHSGANPDRENLGVFFRSSSAGEKGGEAKAVNPVIAKAFLCHVPLLFPELKRWNLGLREVEGFSWRHTAKGR